MRPPTPISAFSLDTFERRDFTSITKAAEAFFMEQHAMQRLVALGKPRNGWFFCPASLAESVMERVRYLSHQLKLEGKPVKPKCQKKTEKASALVSLRIDSHTVIMVPPEKATPEYAEYYREKLRKNQKRY